MAGNLILSRVQLGDNADPTKNMTILAGNDGTFTFARGNADAPGATIATIDGSGNFQFSPPVWIISALINGWVAYGAGTDVPSFYKDPFGVVHFKGLIKDGAMNSAAFILPTGYRGTKIKNIATDGASFYAMFQVMPDGSVVPNTGTNTGISLNNISFLAEA